MSHKHIAGSVIATLLFSASSAFAQGTPDTTGTIAALLEQVRMLQQQLAQLTGAPAAQGGTSGMSLVELVSRLRVGSEGAEVRELQRILAQDPLLYPEGLITGYFGSLTAEAVKRFQRKHGLEAVGEVGPLTRAKIKEWLMSQRSMYSPPNQATAPGLPGAAPAVDTGSVESVVDSILGAIEDDVMDDASEDALPDDTIDLSE